VTRHIVDALKVALTPTEKARLSDDGGTASVEAHDCFLKGREIMFGPIKNRGVFDRAREQFERAIQLDPGYGAAYAALAQAYGFDYNNHWSADPSASLRQGRPAGLIGSDVGAEREHLAGGPTWRQTDIDASRRILPVTSRLQSPAFTGVPTGAPHFTRVQINIPRGAAYSRAPKRNRAHLSSMRGRRSFPLAKVGVEGSNPFARSSVPNQINVL
jgi:hypothetical protein